MSVAVQADRRVGVLGYGSIGSVVVRCLSDGDVPGATLAGVGMRSGHAGDIANACTIDELIERSELIVEAAGQEALAEYGARILDTGCDLLAVSTGALADPEVHARFVAAGPGRLHVCSGAIGGVDMVGAVRALGEIHDVHITTTKQPTSLVQPTMAPDEADALLSSAEPVVLFDGPSRELVKLFPSSTNVAATLALAVGSWDLVRGTVRADPAAELTTHLIEVEAEAGRYRFEMGHHPSAQNPRSSAVVPWAVVRSLRDICGSSWRFT